MFITVFIPNTKLLIVFQLTPKPDKSYTLWIVNDIGIVTPAQMGQKKGRLPGVGSDLFTITIKTK